MPVFLHRGLVIASIVALTACSDGGGNASNINANNRTITGTASKGPLRDAQINFSLPTANGLPDLNIVTNFSAETDTNGQFQLQNVPENATLLVQSSGGSYLDEADQAQNRQISFSENVGLESILPAGQNEAAITVYTQAVVNKIRRLASNGTFNNEFVCQQTISIQAMGFDPFTTQPQNPIQPDPGAPLAERQYAMALGGMANAINRVAILLGQTEPNEDLILAVANDLSDGTLDGQVNGQAISINDGEQALPQNIDLNAEIRRFRNNNFAAYEGTDLVTINEPLLSQNRIPECDELNPLPESAAPLVALQTIAINEGQTLTLDSTLLNIIDADTTAENLIITLPGVTASSLILFNGDPLGEELTQITYADILAGNISIQNLGSEITEDSLSLSVTDGVFTVNASTDIIITLINDAPVANSQTLTVNEDTQLAITLTGSDVDSNQLSFTVINAPSNGVFSGDAPELVYIPNPNFNGQDSFTFVANDGAINSAPATVSITVNPVNDAPIANDQTLNGTEGNALNITLTGADIDNDALTFSVAQPPSNGTLSGTAPNLTYTPNAGFSGVDRFTFTANDGQLNSAPATITLNFDPVNDAPTANAQSVNTNEDTALNITLTGNDLDGDPLTFNVEQQPSNGVISGTAPNITYTPNADFNGSDNFTFVANDGTVNSTPATVNITVNPVNDAPVANNANSATDEDTPATINLTGSDVDDDALTYTVTQNPENGSLSGTAPNLIYTPSANFNGTDSISFIVNDGQVNSGEGTITLTVNPVNDAPTADDQSITTDEDTATNITLTGSDIDGDPITYTITQQPSNGTLVGGVPNVTYTPNADFNGTDSFIFVTHDGTANSSPATISITVNPINDAPVADDQTLNGTEDTPLNITLTGADIDGDNLTYAVAQQPANGTLSGTAPNLTYTPNNGFNGTDSFTFTANDGQVNSSPATITLNFSAVNDAPVADDQSVTTDEDTALGITLTGSDGDGDALTFSINQQPGNGTLSGTAPNVTYTPNTDFNGPDSFTFVANDGTVNSSPATITITVNAVNDVPVAADDSATVAKNTNANIINVLNNDTDVDGNLDIATVTIVTPPSNGTANTTTTGEITYTPNPNVTGTDTLTYTVNDDQGATSNTATVTITVTNTAPIASDGRETTDEDKALGIDLPASDADGDSLTFTITTTPTNGTLNTTSGSITIGDDVTYTPNANFFGTDAFQYTVNDGTEDATPGTINITVNQVFDDITVTDESFSSPGNTQVAFGTNPGDTQTVAALRITGSVLDNDSDEGSGSLTTVADGFATTLGGLAVMNNDGTFDYFPPAGQENTQDTFDYTVQNDGGFTAQGTVTINLDENYWYVNSNATTGGNGRSDQPFTTLAEAESASNQDDRIVVFSGDTAQNYGSITLQEGQRLHGQGITLGYNSNGTSGIILGPNTRPILGNNTNPGQTIITTADRASVTATNITCPQNNQTGIQGNEIDLAVGGSGRFAQMRISNCQQGAIVLTDVTGEALLVNITAANNGQASIYMTGTGQDPKPNFKMVLSDVTNPEHQGVRVENAGDITIETGSITTNSSVTVTNPSTLPDSNHVGIVAIGASNFTLTGPDATDRYEISGFGTDTNRAAGINAGVYLQQVTNATIDFADINNLADSDSFNTFSIAGIKTDGQVEQLTVTNSEFSDITGLSGSPISGIDATLSRNPGSINTLQMTINDNTFNGDGDISTGLQTAILVNPSFSQPQPGSLSERLSLTASNNQSFGASSFFNAFFFDDFPSSATQRHFMDINNNTIYDIADSAIGVNMASNNQAVLLANNNLIDGDFDGTGSEGKNFMNGILVESESATSIDVQAQQNTIRDINAVGIQVRPPLSSSGSDSGNVNTQIDNNTVEYTGDIGINLTVGDLVDSRHTVTQNQLLANACDSDSASGGGTGTYDGTADHANGEHPYTFSDCAGNGVNLGADNSSFFSDSQIAINIGDANDFNEGNQIDCSGCLGAFYQLITATDLTFELGGLLGQGNSFADDNDNIGNNNNLADGIPASTSNNSVFVSDLNEGTPQIFIIDPSTIALPDLDPNNVYPVNPPGGFGDGGFDGPQ